MNSLQLLDTEEVSELIHITVPTLRYWRHMGKGPRCFSMGGRKVFYRREDVEAWVQEQYTSNSRLNPIP
jgi:predicted DNA-binding transcriptional regulator AlpA